MFSQRPQRPINSPPPAPLHLWFYIISILIRRPLWSHCPFVVFAESISNENPHKYVCCESGSSENPKTFSFSGDLKYAVAPEFLSVWLRISAMRCYEANHRCVASLFRGFHKMPARFFSSCLSVFMSYFPHPLASRTAKQPQSILFVKPWHPKSETPEPPQQAADSPDSLYYSEMVLATSQYMAFGGINGWLSLVKMLFFQLSYQRGGIWPSELCVGRRVGRGGGGGNGSYQNKLQTAAFVKDVLLVVVTVAVCDSFSVCLSHTACCSSRSTYSAVCRELSDWMELRL